MRGEWCILALQHKVPLPPPSAIVATVILLVLVLIVIFLAKAIQISIKMIQEASK